ncbi:MAG: 3-hydroxyacyl-CoA dehydrogenase family protein [Thermomicrobiaceae bacterium]
MSEKNTVAIIGAGTMGRQIALQLAAYGSKVRLIDPDKRARQLASDYIDQTLPSLVGEHSFPASASNARANIELVAGFENELADAWLVIEATPERMELKRELFSRLSEYAPEDTILATNSSSFRSGLLADVTYRPERLMNIHFLNHPWYRPAVELMTSGHTDETLLGQVYAYLGDCKLYPVIVEGESTGFLFNRIWRAIKKESLKVVAQGHGVPEDIDRFWCMSTGLKMGPFALMDRVGLDVVLDIERHYAEESGDPNDIPPAFLAEMVERGELGVKSGQGFYQYPDPPFEHPGWPYDK